MEEGRAMGGATMVVRAQHFYRYALPVMGSKILLLSHFQISSETGFLPERPPLPRLPGEYFAPWEDLLLQLPQLIKSKKIREEVDKLPDLEFTSSTLKSEEEWKRSYTMLCFLGQSYIWMDGQKGIVEKVPKKIAVPWCAVSDHLKMKPVGCYAATVLFNYSLRDPQKPWDGDNIYASNTFTGTEDESWFYMVPVLMELATVPALHAIERVFQEMDDQRDIGVQKCLEVVHDSIATMRKEFNRMSERCRPIVFYVDIRPFQAGSKGLDIFPQGIVYEGVTSNPKQFHGASAGQSSIVYTFDIFLGAKHFGKDDEFLRAMLLYMPAGHREFLETLRTMPSVRDYCKKSGRADLIGAYNRAVQEFAGFRSDHVILVVRYIVNQVSHSVNSTLDATGTGGSPFMTFLKKVRDDTLQLLIRDD